MHPQFAHARKYTEERVRNKVSFVDVSAAVRTVRSAVQGAAVRRGGEKHSGGKTTQLCTQRG